MSIHYEPFANRKIELYLHGMHTATVGKGLLCDRHLHHRMIELNYVLEGSQEAIVGSGSYSQQQGDLIVIPPMKLHQYIAQDALKTTYFVVHIQNAGRGIIQGLSKAENCLFPAGHPLTEKMKPTIHRLVSLLREQASDNRIMHACSELLVHLEDYQESHAAIAALPVEHHLAERIARQIEGLLSAIDPQTDDGLPVNWLEDISRRLGISRRHSCRVFQQVHHMSPRQYLAIIRQQEAMHMLLDSEETLSKIAHRIGFKNVQSFIRQFMKWTGVTPGAFRKNNALHHNYLTPLEVVRE